MPIIQPDFSEVAELTPGTYKAHIVDAEQKLSQGGKPYIKWKMAVYDCETAALNGKLVWTNTMLGGAGAFRLKQLLSAAGVPISGSLDTQDVLGKGIQITVVDGIDQNGNPSGFPEVKTVKALN